MNNYDVERYLMRIAELNNENLRGNYADLRVKYNKLCNELAEVKRHITTLEEENAAYEAITDEYEEIISEYEEMIDSQEDDCDKCIAWNMIKNIYYCDKPGKEKTIVIFKDGSKVIKNMLPGDTFDLNIGVALCVAEHLYGGKTKFHKLVKKLANSNKKVAD